MNRARKLTLIGLAVVVIAFAATWISVGIDGKVGFPARFFTTARDCVPNPSGYRYETTCPKYGYFTSVHLSPYGPEVTTLKRRIVVFYASAAVVVVLIGVAFGAARSTPADST